MRLHRIVSFLALAVVFFATSSGEAYGFSPPQPAPLPLDIAWYDGYTGHTDGAAAFVALPDVGFGVRHADDEPPVATNAGPPAGVLQAAAAVATVAVVGYVTAHFGAEHGVAVASIPFGVLSMDRLTPAFDPATEAGEKVLASIERIEAKQRETAQRNEELKAEVENGQRGITEMRSEMDRRLTELVATVEGVRRASEETQAAVATMVQEDGRPAVNSVTASAETVGQQRGHLDQYLRARGDMRELGDEAKASVQLPQAMLSSDGVKTGDAFVPETYVDTLIQRAREYNPLRQHARAIVVTKGDALVIPKQQEKRMGAAWNGRRRAASDTQTDETGTVRIPLHKLDAEPKVTPEMLDDSGIDVVQYLEDELTAEFGIAEGEGFITGDGGEMPLGLLSTATLAKIKQFKSGNATGIPNWKILAKLLTDLPSMYSTDRAKWFFNKSVLYTLLTFETTEGMPLWNFRGLAEGKGPQFLGHGYATLDAMPDMNLDAGTYTTGEVPILFGDMYEAYVIADKRGMTMRPNPFKDNAFVFYYTMKRVGGQTVQPHALRGLVIGNA